MPDPLRRDGSAGKGWFVFILDVYGTTIHFCWNSNGLRHFKRQFPEFEGDREHAGLTQSTIFDTTGHQHIWVWANLVDETHLVGLITTIAHECTHVVEEIHRRHGVPMKGEALAHMIGWLTGQLFVQIPKDELQKLIGVS
jgi:hypothetical protein